MRTGRLLGFRYRLHPGWLVTFAVLLVALATAVAADGWQQPTGAVAVLAGAASVGLVVVSIVAHELMHAVVSRRLGLPVAEIAVLVLGRSAHAEPDPVSPRSELLVALSGPALSVVLGGSLLLIASAIEPASGQLLTTFFWTCWWLGLANIVLAGLHLVPVLPLDGGRIVRALVWAGGRDLDRAGAVTASVSRMFGYLVIGSGLVVALSIDVFYGVWLVLLGWFATRLARAALDRRHMAQLTTGLTVADATDAEPAAVPPTLTVETLLTQEEELRQGVYPVVDSTRLVGVVYPSRLRGRLRRPQPGQRVSDVVMPLERSVSLLPDEPLLPAVERLESLRLDGLPVLAADDPTRLYGVLTRERVLERLRARHAVAQARDGSASADVRG